MSLQNEIRKSLYDLGGCGHYKNIERRMASTRKDNLDDREMPKSGTITDIMRSMDDIDLVPGMRGYRQFKSKTTKYHLNGLFVIFKKRVMSCGKTIQKLYKNKALTKWLEEIRIGIRESFGR